MSSATLDFEEEEDEWWGWCSSLYGILGGGGFQHGCPFGIWKVGGWRGGFEEQRQLLPLKPSLRPPSAYQITGRASPWKTFSRPPAPYLSFHRSFSVRCGAPSPQTCCVYIDVIQMNIKNIKNTIKKIIWTYTVHVIQKNWLCQRIPSSDRVLFTSFITFFNPIVFARNVPYNQTKHLGFCLRNHH